MKRRFIVVTLAAVALLVAGGCPTKRPKLVKVSGTVIYNDKTPVQPPDGGIAVITFRPANLEESAGEGLPPKAASASIEADGRFSLTTQKGKDGVMPGKYKVIIRVRRDKNDASSSLIHEKYGNHDTTPFGEITVDGPKSDFVFEVEKIP